MLLNKNQLKLILTTKNLIKRNLNINYKDKNLCQPILDSFKLYENFITEQEESNLMVQIEKALKRRRYENSHWDYAIFQYREKEFQDWNDENNKIIERMKNFGFSIDNSKKSLTIIPYVHILDLAVNGYIKPHVDAVRFCGSIIVGLSLLSDSIMRLTDVNNKDITIDALLKKRSLYIMKDYSRFNCTHEILSDEESYFQNIKIPRQRRISLICRCLPNKEI